LSQSQTIDSSSELEAEGSKGKVANVKLRKKIALEEYDFWNEGVCYRPPLVKLFNPTEVLPINCGNYNLYRPNRALILYLPIPSKEKLPIPRKAKDAIREALKE